MLSRTRTTFPYTYHLTIFIVGIIMDTGHPLIHSYSHLSYNHKIIQSSVYTVKPTYIYTSYNHTIIQSYIHTIIHSYIHTFIYSSIRSLYYAFVIIPSLNQSFIQTNDHQPIRLELTVDVVLPHYFFYFCVRWVLSESAEDLC